MVNVMFEDFPRAQAEIERLLQERDLARDQAASAAGDLEGYARVTEQAQAENKTLKEAIATAHTELEKVEHYFIRRAKEQSTSKEEALLFSVFSEPYMAVVKAQAILAEGE